MIEPFPLAGDVQRARAALIEAELAEAPAARYVQAQLAALRVAAVVLATRAHPARGNRLRNVWEVVVEVAPEYTEWAGYFATTQVRQRAVMAGSGAWVGQREADDLLRDAQAFYAEVLRRLRGHHAVTEEVG